MRPVEVRITAVSDERLSVDIDYYTDIRPVVRRWYAERSVIEAVCNDLDDLIDDALSQPLRRQAEAETEDIVSRLRSLGLTLFQELFQEECDRLRAARGGGEALTYILFKIDRSLAHLPFEIMYDGEGFLSHEFAMARVIYSDATEARPTFEKANSHTLVLVGDPSEDPVIREDIEAEIDAVKHVFMRSGQFSLKIAAGHEVDQKLLLGTLPGATAFHFTGHSTVSDEETRTGIELKDGRVLSGRSLAGLQNPPVVAFFNMCAAASRDAWKGSLGLVESLLKRGTQACVASLWVVRSKSATLLASCFYEHLLKDETFGHALRKARVEAAGRYGTHDPTWAAYTLYGDPTLRLLSAGAPSRQQAWAGRRLAFVFALLIIAVFILFPSETRRDEPPTHDQRVAGYVLFESVPRDARILIDGNTVGVTPFTAEVPVGHHRVTIEKQGYKRWEAWVEVKQSPRTVIQAYLEAIE